MRKPTAVLIGPRWWDCEWRARADMELEKCLGYTVPSDGRMVIMDDLDPTMTADTFLHECLHALHYQLGIPANSKLTEEDAINFTSSAITLLWAANPKAFSWWFSLFQEK